MEASEDLAKLMRDILVVKILGLEKEHRVKLIVELVVVDEMGEIKQASEAWLIAFANSLLTLGKLSCHTDFNAYVQAVENE